MANKFEREPVVIPKIVEHGGRTLGWIGVQKRTIDSGLTKVVTLPTVTLMLPEGLQIDFGPYVGLTDAIAKQGQLAEFEEEKRGIGYISRYAVNMKTTKRGLPNVVPETEITPTGIQQRVVPAGLSLHDFFNAAASLKTLDPELAFYTTERRIDILNQFQNVVLSKIIAESYRALEELHTTSVPTGSEKSNPAKIAVLHHGDLETHLGNILLVGLPGLNWGTAFIIDLARARTVEIDNQPFTSMEDWYNRYPQLSRENLVLGQTIARYLAERNLILPRGTILLGQRPYTYGELEEYFKAALKTLSQNLGQTPENTFSLVQKNLLRVYIHTLITHQQRRHGIQEYSIEQSDAFAHIIEELFMSEETPTQTMMPIVKP